MRAGVYPFLPFAICHLPFALQGSSPCTAPHHYKVRLWWSNPPALEQAIRQQGRLLVRTPDGDVAVGHDSRVSRRNGKALITICLPREEYVASVLAGESSVFRSEEALKAMAVAARTYAHRFRGRHSKEGFDFCDTTHCQDLRLAARTDRLSRAAEATEGEMLWFEGAPAATYYHRHCGGVTEADPHGPYLRQQHDGYCTSVDRGEWRSVLSQEELARALRQAGLRVAGAPRLELLERSPSGRARSLLIGSLRMDAPAFHNAVGRALGWTHIRSTFFDVYDSGGAVTFQGRGFGHGIGLCQTGASRMGDTGMNYRDILASYYPGTKLGLAAQGISWRVLGGERSEVWVTDTSLSDLPAIADRMIAEAERRSGFRLSYRPVFKFYPTVAAFRDSTGEPGRVAAVTRGRLARLQPASALRSTGVLESTVLHEALHLVIESRAHPSLPAWFREGLVERLAEARGGDAAARARVGRLVREHGPATVLGWVTSGLPADVLRREPADQGR